jgi:hypothetical protein
VRYTRPPSPQQGSLPAASAARRQPEESGGRRQGGRKAGSRPVRPVAVPVSKGTGPTPQQPDRLDLDLVLAEAFGRRLLPTSVVERLAEGRP